MNDRSSQRTDARSSVPSLLAVLAVLLPAAPIVAGFALTSTPASAAAAVSARLSPLAPGLPAGPPGAAGATLPAGSTLPAGNGALVARLRRATTIRASPNGHSLGPLSMQTAFGSPQVMWVRRLAPGWVGVVSPQAGNRRLGWIPASAVRFSRVAWRIEISLAARRVEVLDSGKVLERYTVAIGSPSAPTPTGTFAVTDRLLTHDPSGPYGCCILALSAQAPHSIQGWNGGNRIAIHSTPETSSIGLPVSHGCMRLTLPEGRWLMSHVPLGTPTVISSA